MRFGDLSRAARVYVALVCGLALGQAGLAAWLNNAPEAPLELAILLGLAAAWAHSFPIAAPGKQAHHVSLPFIAAALVLLSPMQLVAVLAFIHVADWLLHRHLRSRFALGFSAGTYISAALLGQTAYRLIWRGTPDLTEPLCLAGGVAALGVFFIQHRVLVSGATWLASRVSPRESSALDRESMLTDAVLLAMGLPLAQLAQAAPWVAAVGAAPLWLIHRALDLPNVRGQGRQDGLTELFTAPYLTETCTRELNRARRFKRQTVLLLLDVDGLGRVNAEYGQAAGDAALRAAALTIKRAIREYDLAARLAGGLFAVLLPETDLAQAQVVAERIRRDAATGRLEVPNSVEQVLLTVSVGGAVLPSGNATAAELFEAARNSLQRAKRDGGNQIEFTTVASAASAADVDAQVGALRPVAVHASPPPRQTPRLLRLAQVGALLTSAVTFGAILLRFLIARPSVDWRLLATLTCVVALAGLGLTFRNMIMALALSFELHIASARALAARYWRLWPMYVALAAIGFVAAYSYQRFGLPVAVLLVGTALAFRLLALQYIDRTLESVRTLRTTKEQLEHRAFHDPLTGLANRALFAERLEHALVRAGASSVAVLFLDLDNFKPVNDTLGHAAGDALLIAASQRLVQCVRREDSIARLGGDEFTVLLENMRDPSDAARLAERIGDSLAEAFTIGGHQVFVSSSIGIALDTDRSHRPDDLLREADMAMYRAKSGGKARYEIFDTGMGTRAQQRLELETDLLRALDLDQLRVAYQDLRRLAGSSERVIEARLEWRHPRRGTLAYADFAAIAEESGAMTELTAWLLRRACADTAASAAQVCVPIPMRALEDAESLVEAVRVALADSTLIPERLCLTLPEAALDSDALNQLAPLGVTLGLGGYGSSPSSLEALAGSAVRVLVLDAGASAVVRRATLALAAALGLRVLVPDVAEPGAATAA